MPDPTARDAVAIYLMRAAVPETVACRWTRDLLAVLGIPPEMTTSDLARAISTHVQTRAWQERVIAEDRASDQEDAPRA